jgi:cytochrome c biogenesis protein CcmG/thiol:disulfide interchange protein DsbE
MRRWLPIVFFAALIGMFAFGLTRDPKLLPSELLDRPFPAFDLAILEDEKAQVDETILEGKVSLVNVFGSWCVACVVEHPMLMTISETSSVNLVGINWRDTRPAAKQWLARYQNPYDLVVFDGESRLAIELGVTGAPETFVTDANGRIRYKHVGPITEDDWTQTLEPLVQVLREEAEINSVSQ